MFSLEDQSRSSSKTINTEHSYLCLLPYFVALPRLARSSGVQPSAFSSCRIWYPQCSNSRQHIQPLPFSAARCISVWPWASRLSTSVLCYNHTYQCTGCFWAAPVIVRVWGYVLLTASCIKQMSGCHSFVTLKFKNFSSTFEEHHSITMFQGLTSQTLTQILV